jgi:hypothetical protein
MAVVMQWRKRRWRCRTQDCPRQTFTEAVGQVPAGMRTTTRLREGLARARWLPEGSGAQGPIRWWRTDPWETGLVDLVGDQALLGQVDGRTSAAVRTWLNDR